MSVKGRIKGKTFERKVANLLHKTIAPFGFTKQDCHRTPNSGGHLLEDRGDIVFSPALRKHVGLTFECKHTKNWSPGAMFTRRKQERDWMNQVLRASKLNGQEPVLIMSGNNTGIYAATYRDTLGGLLPEAFRQCVYPVLAFPGMGGTWAMVPFNQFLRAIEERLRRKVRQTGRIK